MGVERQTNIHTYIHTFQKTISGNQERAHSWPMADFGRTPGLKTQLQPEACLCESVIQALFVVYRLLLSFTWVQKGKQI